MKKLLFLLLLNHFYILALAQEDSLQLEIKEADLRKEILSLTAKNLSSKNIESPVLLNILLENRIYIFDEKGRERMFFSACHELPFNTVTLGQNDSHTWNFDLCGFFYPDLFPTRLQSGRYKIIWCFEGKESEPYYYDYVKF